MYTYELICSVNQAFSRGYVALSVIASHIVLSVIVSHISMSMSAAVNVIDICDSNITMLLNCTHAYIYICVFMRIYAIICVLWLTYLSVEVVIP